MDPSFFVATGEPVGMALRAKKLFAQCEAGEIQLTLLPGILAEAVHVLSGKVFGYARCEVAEALVAALHLFKTNKLDFMDCYLATRVQLNNVDVATFDDDFKAIPNVEMAEL